MSFGANVKAVQRMLSHASAAMTLDVHADLFNDDLNAVSDALDKARWARSGRDGGSRTRSAAGYEPEPGTARIAAIAPR